MPAATGGSYCGGAPLTGCLVSGPDELIFLIYPENMCLHSDLKHEESEVCANRFEKKTGSHGWNINIFFSSRRDAQSFFRNKHEHIPGWPFILKPKGK